MQSRLDKKKKNSLFVEEMKVYTENPKDITRKLLETLNEHSKLEGYKIDTQKSVVFLYTHNEITDNLRKRLHSPLKQKE